MRKVMEERRREGNESLENEVQPVVVHELVQDREGGW